VIALAERYGVQYIPRAEAQATALNSSRLGRGPDADPEDMPSPWSGRQYGIIVDRYSLNPAVEFARASLSEEQLPSPEPTMFSTGDLPLVTASGVDPAVLRWVPWRLRHSAAYATSRGEVVKIFEESDDQEERVQNSAGRAALRDYFAKVWSWATTENPSSSATPSSHRSTGTDAASE
jgi:hypothetical protein